jgi:TolB-like protein
MKKYLIGTSLAFLLALFSFGLSSAYEKEIRALSSALAESISTSGKKSIAVVDFTDLQGNVTELGRFLAEEFSASLSESGRGFEVVDRTHLKSLLKEHQLAQTGLIDPRTARKLGEIAGVQGLITGTLTPFGDSIRLSVKVLDTATAKVIGSSRGDIAKTKAIEELLARGVESVPIIGERQAVVSPRFPPPSGLNSKTVGNITVSIKKVSISKDQVVVALDFFNKSNRELKIARNMEVKPSLLDDKVNRYEYASGIAEVHPGSGEIIRNQVLKDQATTLYPQSGNDIVLSFRPTRWDINIREIGSSFEFSLGFVVYDPKDKIFSVHHLSLSDIKAQAPK